MLLVSNIFHHLFLNFFFFHFQKFSIFNFLHVEIIKDIMKSQMSQYLKVLLFNLKILFYFMNIFRQKMNFVLFMNNAMGV